ncbi:TPA: hypothetical protein ACJX74_005033, partial [Pseudomonas aeruginosa]
RSQKPDKNFTLKTSLLIGTLAHRTKRQKAEKPKLTDDQTTTRPLSQRPSKNLPLRKPPNSTARGKTNKENL